MFTELLILINVFLLSTVGTIPSLYETNCSSSKLGCNCQNIETITKESVESCCKSQLQTLFITGIEVRNLSINITNSTCSQHFQNLIIRETGIYSFHSPFYGLENVVNINIDKNPNFTDFHKLYFYEVSQKIHTISAENNILRTIMPRTFANLTYLVNLKLSYNRIGQILDRSFADLANLTDLQLNNNILTGLNAEMFFGLESLKILSLLNNFYIDFKSNAFKYVPNLQFLYLSCPYNELRLCNKGIIPENVFFPVKRLKILTMKLRIRNLTSLSFYGLNDLERLDLKGNQLTIISSGTLQQIPKVADINLSKNQLRCLLGDTFRNLPRLITLDLSYNDLSYISNDVFADLSSLQTLELSENNIYVMEKNSFVGLKSLLVLTMNVVHGKAKNELQNNFKESSLAKLRNNTIIRGLDDYLGINKGYGEPREVSNIVKPKDLESMKNYCPVAGASDKDWVTQTGSRKYLLIIVGICVVFLLIAFAIIMSYRAWSKHKMNDLSFNVDAHEKQEMLSNKPTMINGRICSKPISESNQTRKSLNGSYMPDVSVDKSEEKTDPFATSQIHQTNSQASIKPVTCPLSNERNHSDDESALTPLGVL